MNRRGFIKGILAMSVAPMFLPGGGRLWKVERKPILTVAFCAYIYDTLPFYDELILSNILPMSSWRAEFDPLSDA